MKRHRPTGSTKYWLLLFQEYFLSVCNIEKFQVSMERTIQYPGHFHLNGRLPGREMFLNQGKDFIRTMHQDRILYDKPLYRNNI